jgi:hypothetical protein
VSLHRPLVDLLANQLAEVFQKARTKIWLPREKFLMPPHEGFRGNWGGTRRMMEQVSSASAD